MPPKRTANTGYSKSSLTRLKRRLIATFADELPLYIFAFTLTLGNDSKWREVEPCAFKGSLHRFIIDLQRTYGVKAGQWNLEWQRRGAPHLHMTLCGLPAAFHNEQQFDEYMHTWGAHFGDIGILTDSAWRQKVSGHLIVNHFVGRIISAWLRIPMVKETRALAQGQFVYPVFAVRGWFQYAAAHSIKGSMDKNKFMQRYAQHNENIPAIWKLPGRVWGFFGDWQFDNNPDVYSGKDELNDAMRVEMGVKPPPQDTSESDESYRVRLRRGGWTYWWGDDEQEERVRKLLFDMDATWHFA